MNDLEVINYDRTFAIDSREVAQMIAKQHKELLRDIRTYINQMNEANIGIKDPSAKLRSADYFIESTYLDSNNQERPCYLITKIGCDFIANKLTGVKGTAFTATYTKKFNQMEQNLKQQQVPQTFAQALRLAADQAEQLETQRPLVVFAETCAASKDSILVRELAKIASKHGVHIGEKRLYQKLREWKMIFAGSTEPYQEYVDRSYFEVTQIPKETAKGVKVYKTTRVTQKGQMYIMDRLKREILEGTSREE